MDSRAIADCNDGMESGPRKVLAQRLRLLRLLRRWSQEDLAAASGLHRTYISLLERAACNVTLDNLEKLARVFGVSVSELFDGTAAAGLSAPRRPVALRKAAGRVPSARGAARRSKGQAVRQGGRAPGYGSGDEKEP